MDNTINSLVSKAVGYTDQQVKDYFINNPNLTDAQIFGAMKAFGVPPSQVASATGTPLKNIMARLAPLLPPNEAVLIGDTWLQAQYRMDGSGENQQMGPLEQIYVSKTTGGVGDKQPVGTPVDQYNANGDFLGTIKTQKEKSFFGGLVDAFKDPVVLAALGGAAASGLLGGSTLGSLTGTTPFVGEALADAGLLSGGTTTGALAAGGTAGAASGLGGTAGATGGLGSTVTGMGTGTGLTTAGAGGLGGTTGAAGLGGSLGSGVGALTAGGLAAGNSLLGGAALGTTLGSLGAGALGSTLGNLATGVGTSALTNTLANTAGSALGTSLGTGLGLSALGNLAGTAANQEGITDARNLINQYGTQAGGALTNAYQNAQNIGAANRTDLSNVYQNLNANLNNTLNAQGGVYNQTGQNLANNYQNLNTNLNNTLNAQAGAYGLANQGINANAANQMGLLSRTYTGQQNQAANNQANLQSSYANTLANMGNVYNQQVGFQQPYQDVGQAGSQGLINNQDYLTRQFGAGDLNSQLAPNYAFQLQQGQMANQRAANMGGGSLGGNALKGLQDYTQNYAAGAYQNAFNNFNTQRQNIYSTLAGMANIGNTSGAQLAGLGNTLGSNMGSLSSSLGGNLTSNTGNLLNAGTAYGSNTAGVTNNLNNVLSSNLGQLQGAYNQYGSNLTGASNTYGGNMLSNAGQLQTGYNQYGSNLTNAANVYGGNLTTGAGQGMNAANVYGLNAANLATGIGSALASNATAGGANTATALSNLGNTALLGSLIKAT